MDSAHENPFVYTLETGTGSYGTTNVVHRNCRAEAWWRTRELLDPSSGSKIALPPDDELLADLTTPRAAELLSGGKLKIESKDDIRKRIGRSTDRADAVIMALFTDAGNWHDAYGTTKCSRCGGGFMSSLPTGKLRTNCPFCRHPVSFDN